MGVRDRVEASGGGTMPYSSRPGAHAVVPHAGIAQHGGAVGGVDVRRALGTCGTAWRGNKSFNRRARRVRRERVFSAILACSAVDVFHVNQRLLEAEALLVEQRRLRIVGGGEVRVHRRELEVGTGQQLRQRSAHVVEAEAQPVHPGVDLQVISQPLVVLPGRRLNRPRGARGRNGRRQAAVEEAVEIADAQRPEHQDLRAHAGLAQRVPLLDVGAGHQIGARLFERQRHLSRSVSVGIGFHDGDHARRAITRFRGEVLDDAAVVGLERVEIDPRDGRPNHRRASYNWRIREGVNWRTQLTNSLDHQSANFRHSRWPGFRTW